MDVLLKIIYIPLKTNVLNKKSPLHSTMKKLNVIVLLLFTSSTFAQVSINWICNLGTEVKETSGLAFVNNTIITHNDSGGKPALLEIDSVSGAVLRTVYIANTTNADWEDLTSDQNNIYIADIGNNDGSRTNLKIYIIKIADYVATNNDTILADTINFNYGDQTNFLPTPMATKYDAEALISFGSSLYIFTKNWTDTVSYIYQIPKTAGSYTLSVVDSIYTPGLITGADINPKTNTLMLCGYIGITPYVTEIPNLQFPFSSGQQDHTLAPASFQYSRQTEAVCATNGTDFFMTAESFLGKSAALFRVSKSGGINLPENSIQPIEVFPNPGKDHIQLKGEGWKNVSLYDSKGKLILTTSQQLVDISNLNSGSYLLIFLNEKSQPLQYQKLLVRYNHK